MADIQIQEIQGLYGPFTLSERVIQKIWLRQDFAAEGLSTQSGKTLSVKDPGRWNLLDGPDFKEARLVLNGRELIGDVEIHFHVADWYDHQHERNSGYDRVALHVVLHGGERPTAPARTSKGDVPEVLFLMPLLERDLESYVMDEALLELEQQDDLEWVAEFLEKPLTQRIQILEERSVARWELKVDFAKLRIASAGWGGACHQMALEVLGYARNRAPMSRLALRNPLSEFGSGRLTAEELFAEESGNWCLSGLRPANHPRLRLAQYLEIARKQPAWPDKFRESMDQFAPVEAADGTARFRKLAGLGKLQAFISEVIFSGTIGEKRLNALICDGLLPLAAAGGYLDGSEHWKHWMPGDAPDALRRFLKHAEIISRKQPLSNGWNQGALALFLARGQAAS